MHFMVSVARVKGFGGAGAGGASACDPTERPSPDPSSTAGTYSPVPGSSSCDKCRAGEFAAAAGSIACSECRAVRGEGYWSSPGSASCDKCEKKFYDAGGSEEAAECRACPNGAVCHLGTVLATIGAKPVFYRFGPNSKHFYECSFEGEDAW